MKRYYLMCNWLILAIAISCASAGASEAEPEFAISAYGISGNSIFSQGELAELLKDQTGPDKTAGDVEQARSIIEKYYHDRGYPTVLVNIPEQNVENGVVRLEVIESRIRRVRVTGNRFFTMEKILKKMPGIQPGKILFVPEIQGQLASLNRHPDLKVAPVLTPGRDMGAIDVELKVKDKLPLHGELELNNRSTHSTSDLRLNALLRYDNLWQKDHSVTFQFQTSPEDTSEVRSFSGSYVLPPFWSDDQVLAVYAIWSDSDTAFGQDFSVIGKGKIFGLRDVIPLPDYGSWYHNISVGIDYKKFDEDLGFEEDDETIKTPVSYAPAIVAYTASLKGDTGVTHLTASLNFNLRGLNSDRSEFEDKRFKARANYVYTMLGLTRGQQLPYKAMLRASLDGQIADQALISNEQYVAGGVESVHGYKENEVVGDNALRGVLELVSPDLARHMKLWQGLSFDLRAFYEYAEMRLHDPLPGQDKHEELEGFGAGLGGAFGVHFNFSVHWGMALRDTQQTESGDQHVYFRVKFLF